MYQLPITCFLPITYVYRLCPPAPSSVFVHHRPLPTVCFTHHPPPPSCSPSLTSFLLTVHTPPAPAHTYHPLPTYPYTSTTSTTSTISIIYTRITYINLNTPPPPIPWLFLVYNSIRTTQLFVLPTLVYLFCWCFFGVLVFWVFWGWYDLASFGRFGDGMITLRLVVWSFWCMRCSRHSACHVHCLCTHTYVQKCTYTQSPSSSVYDRTQVLVIVIVVARSIVSC